MKALTDWIAIRWNEALTLRQDAGWAVLSDVTLDGLQVTTQVFLVWPISRRKSRCARPCSRMHSRR